uniref:ATP-dependent DNA helicase n=1 Tax=Globodera pallida TaxID=36090 RepID=A0A183CD57_GLOPA
MPPPSSRPTRQRKAPQRYSSSSLERWPDVPISCHCKNNTHTGFCASLAANHTPRYYNTLVPFGDNKIYRCPHCAALLLKSEAIGPAAFSKCCAKGQVKMEQQFYELQRPFLRPAQRLQNDENAHNQLDDNLKHLDSLLNALIMGCHPLSSKFIKMVARFNHELAFGTATTEQKPVPGRLPAYDAINLRRRRNLDAGLQLDEELLELLHRLLSHPQIGHPLSGLYFHLKRVYEEAQQQQVDGDGPPVDTLRIRLLTRGEVMRQNLPEMNNIHPHQIQLPESVNQLAQLFFVDGDDGLPPAAEQGVMLKTRSGALTVLPWWDNWVDGAICPLLFPCGGSVWKPSLPLAKPDSAAPLTQQLSNQEVEAQVSLAGDACIKYVLKYVMKGCQLAFVQIVNDAAATTAGTVVVNYDEFRQIRMARYQTPNEALLSIWGNKIVRKSHQVQHQRFHLPGQNRIVVPVGREEERAEEERARIEAEQDQHTPLTAYFTLNVTIAPELAKEHTFLTICNAYWYDRQANQWRQRAQQRKNHLAMLEAASAGNPEHQALRMLLLHVRGPTCWGDLYAGHSTFVEAARALGLLEDSSIWINTILEALSGLPTFRRRLNWTAVLLANSGLLEASFVLDQVLLDSRRLLTPRAMLQHDLEAVRQYVLFRMELVFRLHGVVPGNYNSCCERLGLPAPVGFVMPPEDIIEAEFNAGDYGNRMWAQLMQGDNEQNDSATDGPMTTAQYAAKDAEFGPQLNDKQRNFLDAVCASVLQRRYETLEPTKQLFMLTGDGGTGKTFAYNALIARLKSKMACRLLATASTGIAAQLLFEGATLHSKLRVPIDIDDDTTPMLDYESDPAKLLRALELLIIDEISIADKNVINYVDKLLRSIDVANREKHFGGKIVVFGGDWKQLLPVAECSGALGVDNVNMAYWMSVKTTTWFTNGLVNIHRLTVNMRVTGNQEDYRRTLKTWGTGVTVRTAATDDRRRPYVQLCPSLCLSSEDALIEFVFGDALKDPLANIELLRGAAILCPLNKDTFKLNMELMARISIGLPNSAQLSDRIYTSVDTVDPDSPIDVLALNVAERYIENIYGKTPPGMPEHSLQLKVGAVMMVIKNISVAHGLCNGTRVQIIALGDNIITCRYIQGPRAGTYFKLYRHRFRFGGRGRDATRHGAVKWTRLQFPLRPGFVITTHKAQGQGAATDTLQEQSLDDFTSATAGLSREQLKRLPYNVAGEPSGDCCICKLEIRANNAITTLPCEHNNFHTSCLKKWLKTTATCPNCRAEVHL